MSVARVAAKAGVSIATVSRVINKRAGVSPELRDAVREAMRLLDYRPAPPERRPGPRAGRTRGSASASGGTIGVVLLDEWYQYSPGLCLASIRGVQREADANGWRTVVTFLDREQPEAAIAPPDLKAAVLMGSRAQPRTLEWLRGLPHIWLTSHVESTGSSVMEGNHEIARVAVDYLIGRGHKRLAFLAVGSSYPAFEARARSMRFFAESAGACVDVLMDRHEDAVRVRTASGQALTALPDFATLQARMDRLVASLAALAPRPTGLFVGNDAMAAMCYLSLRARGIEPGQDVEVIGCNHDAALLLGLHPRPATIDLGSELLGRRGVEQLLRDMRRPGESRATRIVILPMLIAPDPAA